MGRKPHLRTRQKKNKYYKIIKLFLSCLFCVSALYIYRMPLMKFTSTFTDKMACSLGFIINDIYINETGAVLPDNRIKNLCIHKGDPFFSKSVEEIFNDLSQNPWIETLLIHKGMPDKIFINVSYKKAIAIFQDKAKFILIDKSGCYIDCINMKISKWKLPVITGDEANVRANDMLTLLEKYPNINNKLKALSYIRKRRWDIVLSSGITVKLPEEKMERALETLSLILQQPAINRNSVTVIDMRIKNKVIFSGVKLVNQNGKKSIKV